MWLINSRPRSCRCSEACNHQRRRLMSPIQKKGLMFLALVCFTESITVTKAVRTVEALGGTKTSSGGNQQQCTSSSQECVAPGQTPIAKRAFGSLKRNNKDVGDCCGDFQRCTEKHPRALEECALLPRGGDVASTVQAAAQFAGNTAITKMPYNIPLNGWKIIFQVILTTINVVCWLVPLKSKSFGENKLALSLANAFSGGVFLSLAFGHLIPECVEGFHSSLVGHYNEATPYMLVLSGYLLIFFVEKVAFDADAIKEELEHAQEDSNGAISKKPEDGKNTSRSAVILLAALAVHSILEMMALGLSDSFSDSAILTVSIALHQPAESIALLVAFLKSGMPKGEIIKFLSVFSMMGPIGVALGMAVNEFAAPIVDAITLAIVAGTFVYVGATEVIPEEFEDSEHKWMKFAALMGGIGSIYQITQYTASLTE